MKKTILFSLYLLSGTITNIQAQKTVTISGYITEKGSGENLNGVNIRVVNSTMGTSSNTYGFYSLSVAQGSKIELTFSYVGLETQTIPLELTKNHDLNISLKPQKLLDEVIITAQKNQIKESEKIQMSSIEIPIEQIKTIPTLLGEKDVLRAIQLLPGVQKGAEGQTGIYVRGGGPDQNLIILDEATVYNANHLFGFFSVFNGDALKSVELIKGGFPAQYGGRLSSVIDLNMKEGNKEKFTGEGGIGLISSRVTLQGPIKKNKSSFLVSARRTYIDALIRPFVALAQVGSDEKNTGGYFFYDLNLKFNYEISSKDKLYLSSYLGADIFFAKSQDKNQQKNEFNENNSGLDWGNKTATFRWNHQFSQKLFSNLSLITTNYSFNIDETAKTNDVVNYDLGYSSRIRDYGLKYDLDYYLNYKHTIKAGIHSTHHTFTPNALVLKGAEIEEKQNNVVKDRALESAAYIQDTWIIHPKLKSNIGLRYSSYSIEKTNYNRLEPRVSLAYTPFKMVAIKAGYSEMNQYLHLLSNTGIGLPTDLWVSSTPTVKPQFSRQFSLGVAKDFKKGFSITIEGYIKSMNQIISYKEGASFLPLEEIFDDSEKSIPWENNVTQGNGWSNGLEFFLQKKVGKFTGWVGYTWSKTQWQFKDLNSGARFYPKYDRRHDLSLVGIYKFNSRITFSATYVYGTGNAITMPIGTFNTNGHSGDVYVKSSTEEKLNAFPFYRRTVNEYGPKNSWRAEAFKRLDVGIQFTKQKKRFERTWELSIYNALNNRNPFFYNIEQKGGFYDEGKVVLNKYSIFPLIPSLSYNFKF
ncbi:MAG: TonB-dependent receptor [Leadbetterella sp.]